MIIIRPKAPPTDPPIITAFETAELLLDEEVVVK